MLHHFIYQVAVWIILKMSIIRSNFSDGTSNFQLHDCADTIWTFDARKRRNNEVGQSDVRWCSFELVLLTNINIWKWNRHGKRLSALKPTIPRKGYYNCQNWVGHSKLSMAGREAKLLECGRADPSFEISFGIQHGEAEIRPSPGLCVKPLGWVFRRKMKN